MLQAYSFVDLTHTLSPCIPNWEGDCGFSPKVTWDYEMDPGAAVKFCIQDISMHAGIGTHIDAPAHCHKGQKFVADIPMTELISPLAVISTAESTDPEFVICLENIIEFERKHGEISPGTFVAFYTGWSIYWDDAGKYRNDLKFPSLSVGAAAYLISKNVTGIGIDTLSPDCPSSGFPVHEIVLGNGKYIVENLANLNQLPPVGATIFVMPMKAECCTESPARVFAAIPKTST
jgi:kynurenine formamidase